MAERNSELLKTLVIDGSGATVYYNARCFWDAGRVVVERGSLSYDVKPRTDFHERGFDRLVSTPMNVVHNDVQEVSGNPTWVNPEGLQPSTWRDFMEQVVSYMENPSVVED